MFGAEGRYYLRMRAWRRKKSESEIVLNAERLGVLALVVGVASIIVSVGIAIWSVRRSETFAQENADRDRPRPTLYVGGIINVAGRPLHVHVGAPFPAGSLTIAQVPLVIRNDGNKTLKGFELLIREPAMISVDNQFLQARMESTLPAAVLPERHFVKSGQYSYVSFSLPDLHPDQRAEIDEPLIVENSRLETRVTALSKDGIPITADFVIKYGFPITVSLAAEDLHTVNYDLTVMGQKAENQEELKSAIAEVARREKVDFISKSGFFRYVVASLHPSQRKVVLLAPKYERIPTDGHEVDLDNGGAVSASISYTVP